LKPTSDGFRNFVDPDFTQEHHVNASPESLLVDRAFMLNLNKVEMTALIGGMRAIGGNHGDSRVGVLTERPGALTNDFFVNLLDMGTVWHQKKDGGILYVFVGCCSFVHFLSRCIFIVRNIYLCKRSF
jgi:catalase-peroxidase